MIPNMSIITEAAEALAGALAVLASSSFVSVALGVAIYIFQALGLYTIAQRRGIKHAWMAWLPLLNMWILGSIADQYRYVARGQIRNRRKVLMGLHISVLALGLVFSAVAIVMIIRLLLDASQIMQMTPQQVMEMSVVPLVVAAVFMVVTWILRVIALVFQYICYNDLYASCCPNNQVLFLVLSILFNITLPFFVFACRNKDGGMPPRKDTVPPVLPAVEGTVAE